MHIMFYFLNYWRELGLDRRRVDLADFGGSDDADSWRSKEDG